MKNDQLVSEIQSHMRRFEDVWYKRTEEGMEVYIADIKEFFVDNGGYVEQYNNVNGDEHYYEINDCLLSAAALVKEYGNAMEKASDFKVPGLSQSYKLLAEYDNVVLAGRELNSGGFEFVTWRQNYNGVEHGNYFGNNYSGAKEDFATRSGLVNEKKLFSDEEYVEMYRCVMDTLEDSYELSDEHKKMLDEHSVYYGNYYHRTVPVIIDNIVKTLHRIQAYTEQDEDDEKMEL